MVRNHIIQVEPTEPAISKMEFDFLAYFPLRADTVAVSNNEHPKHEFGIILPSSL